MSNPYLFATDLLAQLKDTAEFIVRGNISSANHGATYRINADGYVEWLRQEPFSFFRRQTLRALITPALLVNFILLLERPLVANPTGGSVTAGHASILSVSGSTTINQTTNAAIIDWQSFSINSGETTTFNQPFSTSAVLNRVLGGQTSVINGTLTANGQVYLINGNGIVVGPGGVISANGFTGSTRNIADSDFSNGKYHFTGRGNGSVQNLGRIEGMGGDIVLIGKTVDNQGTLNAPGGNAGLIAGDNVLLGQKNVDGSTIIVGPNATATSAKTKVGVHNSGTINSLTAQLSAANGNIYSLAVQNEGTISTTTATKQGGRIWLTAASGTVMNSGTLDSSASATGGNGGTVLLKSLSGTTIHSGTILARGGDGGTGGKVELSGGHLTYGPAATVDTTAPNGITGSLLIDPATITIANSGGTVTPAMVASMVATTDTVFSATTLLTVMDPISFYSPHSLTLNAPTVALNAAITNSDVFGVLLGDAKTVNVGSNGNVQNGLDVAASGGTVNLAGSAYTLNGAQLDINKSLTLNGSKTGTILDANHLSPVMEIVGRSDGLITVVTVSLSNLTLENGSGGGLFIDYGIGGKFNTVTIANSTFSGNSATSGGGIYNQANLTLSNCVVSNNSADYYGGGIYNDAGGSLTISKSTISRNTTNGGGGGIYNSSDGGLLNLSSSTLSGNSAASLGGAIFDVSSTGITMSNCTISGNSAHQYGGIGSIGSGSTTTLAETILAGNSENSPSGSADLFTNSLVDNGHNLYIPNQGFTPGATTDVAVSDINSVLGPLANNGGPTETMALLVGSPAYLAGGAAGSVTTDQRGYARGKTISIGAWDYNPALLTAATTTIVNTNSDTPGDVIGGPIVSLRDAILYANAGSVTNPTITFNSRVFSLAPVISLVQGELKITSSLTVTAPTTGVTIDAHGQSRVMEIDGSLAGITVGLSNLTLKNGQTSTGNGGGLLVDAGGGRKAAVTITNTTFTGNSANQGGGISNLNGTITLSNSTLSNNHTPQTGVTGTGLGGGILNSGSITFVNSTALSNVADFGGGIYNLGAFTASNSTFSSNSVDSEGGGIYNASTGILTVTNGIIYGNSAPYGAGIDNSGGTVSLPGTIFAGNTSKNGPADYYNH